MNGPCLVIKQVGVGGLYIRSGVGVRSQGAHIQVPGSASWPNVSFSIAPLMLVIVRAQLLDNSDLLQRPIVVKTKRQQRHVTACPSRSASVESVPKVTNAKGY